MWITNFSYLFQIVHNFRVTQFFANKKGARRLTPLARARRGSGVAKQLTSGAVHHCLAPVLTLADEFSASTSTCILLRVVSCPHEQLRILLVVTQIQLVHTTPPYFFVLFLLPRGHPQGQF